MKITDISSLDMTPGRLTVWRVTTSTTAEAAWAADSRPASHVQEAHLAHALESAGEGPLPPSWLGIAFDLSPELDPEAFSTALQQWTDRHEVLRSRLLPSSSVTSADWLRRETLPVGVTITRATEYGEFTDGEELAHRIEELFNDEAGPLGWPGYVCATVARPGSTTVHLAADHSLMDGYSIFLTAYEIHTLYAAALSASDARNDEGGPAAAPHLPPAPSYLDFAEAERSAAEALTADHDTIVRWRGFLTETGGRLPEFPIPVNDVSGTPAAQPGHHTALLDASATHAFGRACRAAGGDIFSGLLACLAKVGYETTEEPVFRTMAPFHTRTDHYRSALGWYVGMAPISFPMDDADSFEDTVRSAARGLQGVKELAQTPISRIEELLGGSLRDPFMISYMDLRLTPGARDWREWRTVALRARTTDPDEVCLWIMRTHEGLSVSYRHPATASARTALPHYVTRAHQLLATVAATSQWRFSASEVIPAPGRAPSRIDHDTRPQ
ncbi:condensation domain-containing protein [Streptomyces caeruleatus]|uniref:condensation domain-containing protein n=1 Tax=Streptomyces caeruleatus TaxID=661399 RepID=UPI0007C84247|nr:condensation domain-containing protein [Streptomyces caeruleatus]